MRQLIALLTAAALLAGAATASAGTKVVSPSGKVDGRDHADWLAIFWQTILGNEPESPPCVTTRGVRLLAGPVMGPRTVFDCTAAAGTTVYLSGPSTECSTVEDPPYFGATKADRKACAEKQYSKFFAKPSLVIDGKRVKRGGRYVTATNDFRIRLPEDNIYGLKKLRGRAAAYGAGVLVKNLAPGEHVLTGKALAGGDKVVVVYRLTVM